MSTFQVKLKKVVDDSYPIQIGQNLTEQLVKDLSDGLCGKATKFAVITDDTVRPLYAQKIADRLNAEGMSAEIFSFPAGEKSKTRKTKAMIEDQMLARGFRRDCFVIAAGGGVVTDLAGFLAGTYGRGVGFVNFATTLLAAADASVGGKTAVDTPLATNLIGLFYQPKKVYIDIDAWKSLPKRQISSGLAETVKHACMADEEFFSYLEKNTDRVFAGDREVCMTIAQKNCQIKYRVVEKDETETGGLREVLNLGHTVGRAIETVSDYRLLHGEAVSVGLVAQAMLSESLGYMKKEEVNRVCALLQKANLPTKIPDYIDREALVKKLYTDKKVKGGNLRFVLQKGIGEVARFSPGVYSLPISENQARQVIARL